MNGLNPEVWKTINEIPGWLAPSAADLSYRLIQTDHFRQLAGALVEIGVFKGKYLALIAHAAEGQGRKMIGIDGFFGGYQRPLEPRWVESARAEMTGNIGKVCASQGVEIVHANSESLSPTAFAALVQEPCAFLSIDAGHDAHEVYNDFRISSGLLAAGGIIAADDVFNPRVPGVAEGFFRYLGSTEGRMLAPFASCGNKLFLSTRDFHAHYVESCREMMQDATDGYLLESRAYNDNNARIGFTPRMFGYEVVPFT